MIAKKITDKEEIKKCILFAFKGDNKFFQSYKVNINEKTSLKDTVNKVNEAIKNCGAEFHTIICEDKIIGYFCIIPKMFCLFSFGINIHHRTDENKVKFFDTLNTFFKEKIMVGLYSKNIRAIRFFETNGFKVVNETVDKEGRKQTMLIKNL